MATWDKDKPAGTQKLRLADDDLRANFDALEDAIGRNHNFAGTYGDDAGEHTVVELQDQSGDETQESGLIKIWNNAGDLKIVVPSGTARHLDAIPSGEIILFEKDTVVTGYTLKTDVDDVMPFISKGSAAGGETGGGAHSSGTWTIGGLTADAHTHTTTIPKTGWSASGSNDTSCRALVTGGTNSNNVAAKNIASGNASAAGVTSDGTWRPAARVFTRQERN